MGMPDSFIWDRVKTIISRTLEMKGHQAIIEVADHLPNERVRTMTVLSADRTEHPGSFILVVTHRKSGRVIARASDPTGCLRHFGREIASQIEEALNKKPTIEPRKETNAPHSK